jgi:hypothetical protein
VRTLKVLQVQFSQSNCQSLPQFINCHMGYDYFMMMMLHWELASSAGLKECSCFYFDPQSPSDLLQLLLHLLIGLSIVVEKDTISLPSSFLATFNAFCMNLSLLFSSSVWSILGRLFDSSGSLKSVLQVFVDRNPLVIGLPNGFGFCNSVAQGARIGLLKVTF